MNSILRRRRGMMGVKDKTLLYNLENYSFSMLNITIPNRFLVNDKSRTLMFDIDVSENPTTSDADGSTYRLFRCWGSGGTVNVAVGKMTRSASTINILYPGITTTTEAITGTTTATGRKRILLTHSANSDSITVYSKMGTGALKTQTFTGTYAPSGNIVVGGGTTYSIKSGKVNRIALYDRIVSSNEINTFFA